MKSVFSKSNYLLFVTVIVLLLSIVNAGVVYYLSDRMRQDARVINYAGILRGSIQRAVKLETAGVKSDQLIQRIDSLINRFEDREKVLKLREFEGRFIEELELLKGQWGDTVRRIGLYRQQPSRERLRGLLESSEKCWDYSN
ncbi:MAG TPA: hypothetical protein ENN21_06145, partial [Spirochaetes bacterium]|nr:hypothetical protein [Spirochaetota bacterium]